MYNIILYYYSYIGLHTVPSVGQNRLLFTSFHKYIYYIHWFLISIKYTNIILNSVACSCNYAYIDINLGN